MKKEITLNVGSGIGQMSFDPENHEGIDIDKIRKIVSPETDFILHNKIRILPISYLNVKKICKYKPAIGKHWRSK